MYTTSEHSCITYLTEYHNQVSPNLKLWYISTTLHTMSSNEANFNTSPLKNLKFHANLSPVLHSHTLILSSHSKVHFEQRSGMELCLSNFHLSPSIWLYINYTKIVCSSITRSFRL
jgi:hypothetical protein